MSLIGNAIKSKFATRAVTSNYAIPFFQRDLPKRFSTESEQQPDSTVDSLLQTPKTGVSYGRLSGTARFTLKSDILSLLECSKLTPDDVKIAYNQSFMPLGMLVQFPSAFAYDDAFKMINRKGRLYKLERADRSQWDQLIPYNGKTVLLHGIPRNALPEDVERFLCGCDYDSSSIEFSNVRLIQGQFSRMTLVHFPTPTQAMSTFIKKNRSFCLNNQISVQVLQ